MQANTLITGLSGTGRTVYLSDEILETIQTDKQVIIFDPYGDLIENILKSLPEEELSHTTYFAVGRTDSPVGLNIFEATSEEEKRTVSNTVIELMYDLFDPNRTGIIGPRFENAVRNAILTILSSEDVTFFELLRCLLDHEYVRKLLPKVDDPIIQRYWTDQIAQSSDAQKSEVLDYIVSKFDKLITNANVRNIIGQGTSSIRWEKLLSEKKILLIDFSALVDSPDPFLIISTILFAKLVITLKQREHPHKNLCTLFVDEVTFWPSSSLKGLLIDGRRFGVTLHITTQRLADVSTHLQKELLRIESLVSFRIAMEDAKLLTPQFHANIPIDELCILPKFHALVKKMHDGSPQRSEQISFRKADMPKSLRNAEEVKKLKDELGKHYYRSRSEVEEEINKRITY